MRQMPRLTVKKAVRGRPWKLCLNDDCPTMVEMREKRAEREAAKEAREAAKKLDGDAAGATTEADAEGARPRTADGAGAEEARADHGSHEAGPLQD